MVGTLDSGVDLCNITSSMLISCEVMPASYHICTEIPCDNLFSLVVFCYWCFYLHVGYGGGGRKNEPSHWLRGQCFEFPSVLGHCYLGDGKGIWPAKKLHKLSS